MLSTGLGKLAACACIAVLASQVSPAAEPSLSGRGRTLVAPPGILDVALVDYGVLRGSLVDVQGTRLPHRTVVISQQGPVATTRTDSRGSFEVSGLCGGMYFITVDGGQQVCRCWATGTAPPCAVDDLLIVCGGSTVRGQFGGPESRRWLNQNAGQIAIIGAFIALPVVYATKPYGS